MEDWAETREREFLSGSTLCLRTQTTPTNTGPTAWVYMDVPSGTLAALLREVDKQGALNATPLDGWVPLAEVRRVVSEIGAQQGRGVGSRDACDEILSRLEALK